MSKTFDAEALTIVGAAFEILDDWHTVIARCLNCEAHTVFRLTIPKQPVVCPTCGTAIMMVNEADVQVVQVVVGRPRGTS